ncbi:hypothetical protein GCM10010411_76610 [Actinomadura fulvescens]|uniref:Uncharacterized protein n=1 Tax=Actinomadura fulvescens TaxID=46160 RepID=A0ABN3QJB4_9ACTN
MIRTYYAAVTADRTGANIYTAGINCLACDPTYDPHFRTGVLCTAPAEHASVTVTNWAANDHGHGGDVIQVEAESFSDARTRALAKAGRRTSAPAAPPQR